MQQQYQVASGHGQHMITSLTVTPPHPHLNTNLNLGQQLASGTIQANLNHAFYSTGGNCNQLTHQQPFAVDIAIGRVFAKISELESENAIAKSRIAKLEDDVARISCSLLAYEKEAQAALLKKKSRYNTYKHVFKLYYENIIKLLQVTSNYIPMKGKLFSTATIRFCTPHNVDVRTAVEGDKYAVDAYNSWKANKEFQDVFGNINLDSADCTTTLPDSKYFYVFGHNCTTWNYDNSCGIYYLFTQLGK